MAEYFTGSMSLLAVFSSVILTVYFIVKLLKSKKPRHRYPPALPSIPILGSFPLIKDRRSIHKFFAEKAKHLGSVFSCYLGSRYTILLNDRTSVREALLMKGLIFSDRKVNCLMEFYFNPELKGITSRRFDPEFKHLHQLVLNILKDFGLGQSGMEERIGKEIEELIPRIREVGGKAFDPADMIQLASINVVYSIAFGKRGSQGDPELKYLQSVIRNLFANDPVYVHHCPILRFLPYYSNQIKVAVRFWDKQTQFIIEKVREVLDSGTGEKSFVGAFVQREGPDYDKSDLTETTRSLFNAGSETTTFTVLWALALLANYPELQKRVQDELDSAIPSDRLPSISDTIHLPLTEATIMEVMRFKTLLPLSVTRRTLSDTEVAGYYIPKGTVVMPNIYAVHMDKNDWGDPEVFRPERFLDESGHKVVGRNRVMSFSIGKRSCLGEGIARPEIFLLISSLVHQFDICPPDGQVKIDCEEVISNITKSTTFQMRLIPRKQK